MTGNHTTITPFLMFEGAAAEAMEFYISLFNDGEILSVTRHDSGIQLAEFRIAGQRIFCSDSTIHHDFTFTPSTSLFVTCRDEAEQNRLYQALGDRGATLMPPANYGFSTRFAWVNDRFGVSWQINLP